MEKLREEVISNLRASLISTKGKCDLRQIRSDYKMLMGCEIPYKKFGYNTLEDFLYSIDSLTVSQGPNGLLVSAKSTQKSSHMVDLISKQKTAPKKKKIFVRPERRNYGNRMAPPSDSRWRPKNVSNKWKDSYQSTARPSTLAHNQFVNVPTPQKKSPESLPPRFNRQPPSTNNNNIETDLRKYLNNKHQMKSDPKDLRHLLNQKKTVSFESDSSASSSSSDLLQPHSAKTNCAALMQGIPVRRNCPPVLTSTQIENLKNNSLASIDTESTVWDSWTSGEEGDTQKVNKDFKPTGDSIVDLFSFTQNRKLPEPVFKVIQRKGKPHKISFFDCQIKVASHSYSSYPKDFTDEVSAKQCAAQEALQDLIKTYSKRKSLLLSTEQDILSRIPPMVEKHFHGIWNWQLEADYADLFHEQLPLNWMQIVDMSPMISVEAFLDNKYVLRFCKPEDILQKGKRPHGGHVSEVSVPSNTINFKEDEMLMATITCVVSAKEIWCRQICTPESEAFDKMMESFEKCYMQCMRFEDASRAKNVIVGGYYVAFFENNFYRVRVFDVNGDAEVSCFFIDYGDEQLIPRQHIYQLMREFAKEQAQAFICRLAGLEDLYEVSFNSSHLLALNERVVQMDTDSEETVKNDPSDPISVVLYDSDSNVSINEQLIAEITMESATPVLNRFGVTEAYVSHVEKIGDVYLHIHSPGFEKLENLMSELELSLSENRPDIPRTIPTPENSKDRLYIAKYKEDDHWYRVKIIDWAPRNQYAQIYFVDFGNCEVVKVAQETMYPLDELSDVINQFPAQAVKVRMMIDRVRPDFAEKVAQLMPNDQPVLLKVIETDNENVPWVKFFKRIMPSNDLVSINESINLESEINESSKPEKLQRLHSLSRFDDLTQNKNVPSAGFLSSPPLPKVGEYLDVKVPCAVSPWNFFVQPYESNDKLSKLMMSLQMAYGNVTHSPLQITDILPGRIYASKHDDGMWYRTSVIKVIHSGSISVFYCDFGYYASLTLQQLIPLDSHFMELPYQAIKAKLAGIKPKQEKWTMDNCKNFQKLVVRKTFVSILTSIETDEMYRSDTVLNLKLIDTSTATDVHVDQILVMKDIAVELDK